MKKKSIALLCALTLVFTGCNSGSDTSSDEKNSSQSTTSEASSDASETSDTAETPSIQITYKSESKTYQSDDKKTDVLYTDYSDPTVTIKENKAATAKIADFFKEEKKTFDSSIDSYLTDAKSALSDYPDGFYAFYLSQAYETQRCDEQIISIKGYTADSTGGAHGNYAYIGYNFDTKTGKKLTLDDIATDKTELLDSARTYINSQLELPAYSQDLMCSVEDCQDIINSDILTDGNWYFTKSGLTFISNVYILGSYAGGASFFTVPYQQLEGLKADYQYTGNFELSGPVGSTLSADLNGDESMDAVYYDANYDESTGNVSCTLTINGTDFSSVLQSDDRTFSEGATSTYRQQYYLIDLDSWDEYTELAIQDNGDNDYNTTYFFRYDGKDLSYLGYINDLLNSSSTTASGDGTVIANLRISLLETLSVRATYQLDGDTLALVPQDWYNIDYSNVDEKYQNHNILKDVTVYTEPDTSSDPATLTSKDGPVSFPSTDNDHWFTLKTTDGTLYYLYIEQYSSLENGEDANTVFENLLQAG